MPRPRSTSPDAILAAAFARFTHYGFRRTSMEDIADEAGVSRAALYLHFRNKEELFRSLSQALHEEALAGARAGRAARRSSGGGARGQERPLPRGRRVAARHGADRREQPPVRRRRRGR